MGFGLALQEAIHSGERRCPREQKSTRPWGSMESRGGGARGKSSSLGAISRAQENMVFLSEGRREQEWFGVWRMVVSGWRAIA